MREKKKRTFSSTRTRDTAACLRSGAVGNQKLVLVRIDRHLDTLFCRAKIITHVAPFTMHEQENERLVTV